MKFKDIRNEKDFIIFFYKNTADKLRHIKKCKKLGVAQMYSHELHGMRYVALYMDFSKETIMKLFKIEIAFTKVCDQYILGHK